MSDSSSGKEENGSLDSWTFVEEESAENEDYNRDNEDDEDGVVPPTQEEEEEEEVEVTEEEEEEDAAATGGQQVEEVKVGSGTESSDIETLEYPGVEELRELYNSSFPHNQGMSDSFPSFLTRRSPFPTGDADTESLSSEGSHEETVRQRRTRKPEAIQDEETDLSLASSPSLPDDLPAIKPDSQYVHTPDKELNQRLNLITWFVIILVVGLGCGHFLGIINLSEEVEPGWSRRSLWDENLNAAQILEHFKLENEELGERVLELAAENMGPFKIKGKEGKEARSLRERINHLIAENEDMRLALSKHQFSAHPDADKTEFNEISQENYKLRTTFLKLTHLVPDNDKLEKSLEYLKDQHLDLLRKVGKIRYEQPLPKELTPMVKQLEEMRNVVVQESKKRNPPSSIANARSYLTFMGQVFSQFTYLHDWEEKSAAEKIDLAKDIFSYWLPKGIKVSPKMQEEIVRSRNQFSALKNSLRKKWRQLKDFTNPDTIVTVGQATVAKMNRVIVNVVSKIKEIGQTTIMSSNKQLEQSIVTMSTGLAKLNKHFDETWKSLEIRISMSEKYGTDDTDDQDSEDDDDDDDDDDENGDDDGDDDDDNNPGDVIDNYIKSSISDKDDSKAVNDDVEEKHASSVPDGDKKADAGVKSHPESKKIKEEIQKQIMDKEIDKIKGKDEKREASHAKRRNIGKSKKEEVKEKEKKPIPVKPTVSKIEKEIPQAKGRELHQKEKNEKFVKDDRKEPKKSLEDRLNEKKEEEKLSKEDSKYFKGQYNRFDKVKESADGEAVPDFTGKYYRRKDEDDDDEDDDEDVQKASGLKRHWEKPQKKNYFREHSGPKKQFIRRRGDF